MLALAKNVILDFSFDEFYEIEFIKRNSSISKLIYTLRKKNGLVTWTTERTDTSLRQNEKDDILYAYWRHKVCQRRQDPATRSSNTIVRKNSLRARTFKVEYIFKGDCFGHSPQITSPVEVHIQSFLSARQGPCKVSRCVVASQVTVRLGGDCPGMYRIWDIRHWKRTGSGERTIRAE